MNGGCNTGEKGLYKEGDADPVRKTISTPSTTSYFLLVCFSRLVLRHSSAPFMMLAQASRTSSPKQSTAKFIKKAKTSKALRHNGPKAPRRREADRIAYLENDRWVGQFTATKVFCLGCNNWIKLDGRSKYYIGFWDKHKGRCPGIAAAYPKGVPEEWLEAAGKVGGKAKAKGKGKRSVSPASDVTSLDLEEDAIMATMSAPIASTSELAAYTSNSTGRTRQPRSFTIILPPRNNVDGHSVSLSYPASDSPKLCIVSGTAIDRSDTDDVAPISPPAPLSEQAHSDALCLLADCSSTTSNLPPRRRRTLQRHNTDLVNPVADRILQDIRWQDGTSPLDVERDSIIGLMEFEARNKQLVQTAA